MALVVKNPPASSADVRDVGSVLRQEDPLEEGMATTPFSDLENPHGQKGLVGYIPLGCTESGTTEVI